MQIRPVPINFRENARAYADAAGRIPAAVERGFRKLAVMVHRAADANLSGPSAAWSYPVPRRSGDLARGMYSRSDAASAEVGNSAPHAWAVHSGQHPFWKSPPARPRPFLYDAADSVDAAEVIGGELRGAW